MRFSVRRLVVLASVLLLVVSVVTGLTAANAVPMTKASDRTQTSTVQMFVPSYCAGLGITSIHFDDGDGGNNLVLGSAGRDRRMNGGGGNDCILGGAGNDDIRGDGGFDICIGGPGNDDFRSCEVEG